MTWLEEQLKALRHMRPPQLRAEWRKVFKTPAPDLSSDLLIRIIGYRLQEKAHGGLAPAVARQLDRMANELADIGTLGLEREIRIKPGTRLVRDWQGKSHHVQVLEDGFLYEDRHYHSLTQIAFAITGVKWSGPRFFGLKKKAGRSAKAGKVRSAETPLGDALLQDIAGGSPSRVGTPPHRDKTSHPLATQNNTNADTINTSAPTATLLPGAAT